LKWLWLARPYVTFEDNLLKGKIKMTLRRLKKKVSQKLNLTNYCMSFCAIVTSFFIVSVCGAITDKGSFSSRTDTLVNSAERLANAFEIYNQKRFAQ